LHNDRSDLLTGFSALPDHILGYSTSVYGPRGHAGG